MLKRFGLLSALLFSIILSSLTLFSCQVFSWGKEGHRIVAHIATSHLTEQTRQQVLTLLDGKSLVQASTWADDMRKQKTDFWKSTGRWHYINLNAVSDFDPSNYSKFTSSKEVVPKDIYGAILYFTEVLKRDASPHDKKQALQFLIHFVADVHQPLHVGRKKDRGGNNIQVTLFDKKMNLHQLWDSQLIKHQGLSYAEFANNINTKDPQLLEQYKIATPDIWVVESFQLVQSIYQLGNKKYKNSYVLQNTPILKERLLQAGVRLAELLNDIFDSKHAKN